MWVEGTVQGSYIRRSLQTVSWEHAQILAQQIESADDPRAIPPKPDEPITIKQAVEEYLADAKARGLSEATLYKLDIISRKQFLGWAKSEGYSLLREFDLRAAQAFRASWQDGALAKKKKQERLTLTRLGSQQERALGCRKFSASSRSFLTKRACGRRAAGYSTFS